MFNFLKRNPCAECLYFHADNNTCQSKKCCTYGDGRITILDRLFCEPYKGEWTMKITVKKNPPKRAEVYDRLLEGEDKKNFLRRIAEVLVRSERKEKNEGKELS